MLGSCPTATARRVRRLARCAQAPSVAHEIHESLRVVHARSHHAEDQDPREGGGSKNGDDAERVHARGIGKF